MKIYWNILALFLVLLLPNAVAQAQYGLSFSGYVVEIPIVQRTTRLAADLFGVEQDQFMNVNRLRLRPALSLWPDAQLTVEYELSLFYHSSPIVFQVQSKSNQRQIVDAGWYLLQEQKVSALHYLDRFHFKQSFEFGDLTIGRQRIAWGTGRIWNPTDLFNPINPTSVAKIEKDGVDAALFKFRLGNFTDLSLVVNPQRGWSTANVGYRFRANYQEFDFSLVGGYFDNFVMFGGDFAGNLFDAGVRGEALVTLAPGNYDFKSTNYILGADYQFSSRLYGLLEYHFNGEGQFEKSQYDLPHLANGEILNVGRQYISALGTYLVHPLVTLSLNYTRNLSDRSQFIAGSISASASDELSLALGGQLFFGENFSEYWYYPRSLYLKADLYF
ncbi:MAG: hypothetical protein V1799_12205 [bacterium]